MPSKHLQEFVNLISKHPSLRDIRDIEEVTPWLRKESALLKNLESDVLVDIVKHGSYIFTKKDSTFFRQGEYNRHLSGEKRFFIILYGAAALYIDPSIKSMPPTQAPSPYKQTKTPSSFEASASRTNTSGHLTSLQGLVDISQRDEYSRPVSEISLELQEQIRSGRSTPQDEDETLKKNTVSDLTKRVMVTVNKLQSPRPTYGRLVVKYGRGKYFGEAIVVNDSGQVTASVVAEEDCDVLVLEEDLFNRTIKEHLDKEARELSDFVDNHPFFCHLHREVKNGLQIALRRETKPANTFIVKQGNPVKKIYFIINGLAEMIAEPYAHRKQYPHLWPFETSTDVYFNEFEWLRDSRRRTFIKKYEEVEKVQRHRSDLIATRKHFRLCFVQGREVIGETEVMLNLRTSMQSVRCATTTEVYVLPLRNFKRLIRRKTSEICELIHAYIHTKLTVRLQNPVSSKIPLMTSLLQMVTKEMRTKSLKYMTVNTQKIAKREAEMLNLLEWFKVGKAPLVPPLDPTIMELKEAIKRKARMREKLKKLENAEPYYRPGRTNLREARAPKSVLQLKAMTLLDDSELQEVLKVEVSSFKHADEMNKFLRRFSVRSSLLSSEISSYASTVAQEKLSALEYHEKSNHLIAKFKTLLAADRMTKMTRDESIMSEVLFDTPRTKVICGLESDVESSSEEMDYEKQSEEDDDDDEEEDLESEEDEDDVDEEEEDLTIIEEEDIDDNASRGSHSSACSQPRTRRTRFKLPRMNFREDRGMTPRALEDRIKDFHLKYGGTEAAIKSLPSLRSYQESKDKRERPLPGGKVFVTKTKCVSCASDIKLKDHEHVHCHIIDFPISRIRRFRRLMPR
ncbi:hypothetical protein ACJMK2_023659 [Sinanodonta woodiana]|uniref:Cyclic nucleotide-binding domain-containing protein n=1 Tax=Sinanodonta woodiana TaxID=1069815 RepID=A0ABD3T5R2_SINWO